MERNSFWYLKQFLDAIDNEDLTYEEKCRATYALCYYGIKGTFPPEATGMDKMYARSNEKLFEGQDAYKEQKKKEGQNGGQGKTGLTDEEIREAYAALYFETGHYPSEKEVIEKTGANVSTIRGRKVWKEESPTQWIEMYRNKYSTQQDIQNSSAYTANERVYTVSDF